LRYGCRRFQLREEDYHEARAVRVGFVSFMEIACFNPLVVAR
jgi:hypothetical protein